MRQRAVIAPRHTQTRHRAVAVDGDDLLAILARHIASTCPVIGPAFKGPEQAVGDPEAQVVDLIAGRGSDRAEGERIDRLVDQAQLGVEVLNHERLAGALEWHRTVAAGVVN